LYVGTTTETPLTLGLGLLGPPAVGNQDLPTSGFLEAVFVELFVGTHLRFESKPLGHGVAGSVA
jgi:hypothetical protein